MVVYAAYGDHIISWNATSGKRFQTLKIENELFKGKESYYTWVDIKSLLLYGTRLMVIVDGNFDPKYDENPLRALGAYLRTRLLIFDVGSDGSELQLLAQKDLNGYFTAVRAEGGNAHIVTSSGLRMYDFLGSPFALSYDQRRPRNLEAYYQRLTHEADNTYIPKYIQQLRQELTVNGEFPTTVRLCRWQTEEADDGKSLQDFVYTDGFVNSVSLVTSFDLGAAALETSLTQVKTSAAFPKEALATSPYERPPVLRAQLTSI